MVILSVFSTAAILKSAFGLEPEGIAKDYGIDLQNPVTDVAQDVYSMHLFVTIIMALITLLVLGLLVWVCYKYSENKNKKPSKTVHNTLIEILWTAIPVLILVVIAVPSFKLLYKQDVIPEPDLTIKAIGYQWYWGYEYPDNGNFAYEAFMVQGKDELEEDKPYKRMLTTDTKVVVPVNKIIRMQVTAADVLHSWAIPAFGVKTDAVPGRLNETWFKADKIGIYYGMCSELCGVNHQSMPIEIHVVNQEDFDSWVEEAKTKYASKNNLLANN
ncbi:MAG: cytochrome c oxidase subunit II [Rickettsiales bacterium]|nr:cytochrome c oxidase subunit II [Rickettsiales bacterium]OUV83500.1 MAG: cytochrome c oxidase subunit II [Rickettsiales bacterium TMED131]|tara:strand:- start:128 stop:943 length:816 start_codon:yes stop_codon:yes gene_type:complete